MPTADLYPSRMKFLRKTATEKSVDVVSVVDHFRSVPLSFSGVELVGSVDVDRRGVEKEEENMIEAPEVKVMELEEAEPGVAEEGRGGVEAVPSMVVGEGNQLRSRHIQASAMKLELAAVERDLIAESDSVSTRRKEDVKG